MQIKFLIYKVFIVSVFIFLISFFSNVHARNVKNKIIVYDDDKPSSKTKNIKTSPNKNIESRLSGSISLLIHNNPMLEMAFFDKNKNTFYALQYKPWSGRSDSSYGVAIAAAYDATFKNGLYLRVQTGLESSGFIAATLDGGFGVIKNIDKNKFRLELYLATIHTGGRLQLLTDTNNKINIYTFMLGIKSRIAYEIPIKNKWTISPYISYAAYPYIKSSRNVVFNGGFGKYIYDSFQFGLEFSSYR